MHLMSLLFSLVSGLLCWFGPSETQYGQWALRLNAWACLVYLVLAVR